MERVQFQQEQMLQELKDLVDKKLFTEKETRQIMKKRTAFENTLVRRIAKKADFLRYASYEMGLELLRRKRVERMNLQGAPPTVSDYALVRRQFHIFERALKKFKSDVGLWVQYIQVAKREGARALVGRITARALQLHPNKPALYILAASHELSHLSPSSARALLQRGIRMNPDSVEMWREYVRMELGFIESLRRRWDILGIAKNAEKGKGKARDDEGDDPSEKIMVTEEDGDASMEVDAEFTGDEGAAARREIMDGAIVKSVITSASQALPKIELFDQLKGLITEYPSPPALRQALLDHLYETVREKLPGDSKALQLLASRFVTPDLAGEALVDGLRRANEAMLAQVGDDGREDIFAAYADFVEQWCGKPIDDPLKAYLISSLQAAIQRVKSSASLLSAHINLLIRFSEVVSASPAKVLKTARKYTERVPTSANVWLARLDAEKRLGAGEEAQKSWAEARRRVRGSGEEMERVWTWGVSAAEPAAVRIRIHEGLLKESMGDSSLRGVHEMLLDGYVSVLQGMIGERSDQGAKLSETWLEWVRHMGSRYLTTGRVWKKVFTVVEGDGDGAWTTEADGKWKVLGAVYEAWRRGEEVEAAVGWGRWLAENGKGQEASQVVARAVGRVGEGERSTLEAEWRGVLDRE